MKSSLRVKKISKKEHLIIGGGIEAQVFTTKKPSRNTLGEFQVNISRSKFSKNAHEHIATHYVHGELTNVISKCEEYCS